MKKVVIAGGTGNLGNSLVNHLLKNGYTLVVLSRKVPQKTDKKVRYVLWDAKTTGPWTEEVDGSYAVVNLCGKPVACRYTEKNKRELISSRTEPTQILGEAIRTSANPPKVWINGSSSALYGFADLIKDEHADAGDDFPASICKEWEKVFWASETPSTRKVAWRLAVVLQRDTGLILPFAQLVKFYLGGKLGSGEQYFTWIHEEDFLNAAIQTLEREEVNGPFNITSPAPVTNRVFMDALKKAMGYKNGFSMPAWMVAIGGFLSGIEPYLILNGRRVVSTRLPEIGFHFRYPDIGEALTELFRKKEHGL